ncbi:unnamed protein product [Adineta ricciae]|uniref:Uncharacterized protein n=1 Tax=Adineta ricciae TaxID=249248 RepID=A0A814CDZ7_ADIRI|nr:unnamed protein product [Adineta ricciae]CAF1490931.1 unnamed protein product [Adineta ricciae]
MSHPFLDAGLGALGGYEIGRHTGIGNPLIDAGLGAFAGYEIGNQFGGGYGGGFGNGGFGGGFVTKREIVNEAEIQKSADQFVSEVKSLLPYYNEDFVLNTDQAVLEGEFPSARTLSYQGEKTTLTTVRSVNATTHSYTVRPKITMSSKIFDLVYICLKEVNGRMGDNIKGNLPQLKNVVVTCSASSKLTISLVEYWRNECLIPSLTSQPVLLLSDSWPGQAYGK